MWNSIVSIPGNCLFIYTLVYLTFYVYFLVCYLIIVFSLEIFGFLMAKLLSLLMANFKIKKTIKT